jgi:multisubunit Na+/H+ antiporter MnhE subunit
VAPVALVSCALFGLWLLLFAGGTDAASLVGGALAAVSVAVASWRLSGGGSIGALSFSALAPSRVRWAMTTPLHVAGRALRGRLRPALVRTLVESGGNPAPSVLVDYNGGGRLAHVLDEDDSAGGGR